MHMGPGPVFVYECLANSRRWQTYVLRALGVLALLIAMGTIATTNMPRTGNSQRDYAYLGEAYFYALIGVELALVMLAAPAATAGSICIDRARGTLAHMLMTDLSDPEIVLGKLGARLVPVLGLVACSWPVLAISSLLGGIDPVALVLAFAVIIVVAVLGCATALTLSVWAKKSHEVILATYLLFILGMMIWPITQGLLSTWGLARAPEWLLLANPYYVAFAPYAVPGKLGFWEYLGFFGTALLASAGLTALAVRKTRPVACRGTVEKSRGPRIGLVGRILRWLPGPSLDRSPVLWREWHRSRPTRWMLILLLSLMGTTGVLCVTGAIAIWVEQPGPGRGGAWVTAGVMSYALHVVFGLLMLAAVAPTSMAEERQRGSLDVLAATALSTRSIVIGKWLGTFRFAAFMAIGPGLIALAAATAHMPDNQATLGMSPDLIRPITLGARLFGVVALIGTILAHGALITSIGLALAVWIKRQSRAGALSVALFTAIILAWPILAVIVFKGAGMRSQGIAALSPAVACTVLLNVFSSRTYGYSGNILWWGSFWAVEVAILAMGLLWLTIRTIDGCFDRIPDEHGRMPVRAVVTMLLVGLIGAGSIVGAVAAWSEGVEQTVNVNDAIRAHTGEMLAYTLLLGSALTVVAASASASLSAWRSRHFDPSPEGADRRVWAGSPPGMDRWPAPETAGGTAASILRLAWESIRPVLLLAIGPALLAAALATTRENPQYVMKMTKGASGSQAWSWVRADEGVVLEGVLSRGERLSDAALLFLTILVHGALAVSLGLALATVIERRWLALGATIGVSMFLVLGVPIFRFLGDPEGSIFTMWSFVTAGYALLVELAIRRSGHVPELGRWVILADAVLAVVSIGLLWLTVRVWQRRQMLQISPDPANTEGIARNEPPAVEAALVGD